MHWPDSFQANRRLRTTNLVLQVLLFLALFAGLNYLALRHPKRFDLTRNRFFSLSAETKSYLDQLKDPVHIVVAFEANSDDEDVAQTRRDILSLLREYGYAGRVGATERITTEELDVFQQRGRADSLGISDKNVVVFVCGERRRIVSRDELFLKEEDGKPAFIGERAFTAAILDVTSSNRPKLYFVVGHDEMDPGSVSAERGLSQLRDSLRARNFEIETLNLARTRRIPDDAAVVLTIGPQAPLLPQEQELLREYLSNRAGRLVVAVGPALNHPADTGLAELFSDWGLQVPDCLVIDPDPDARMEGGDLILIRYGPHPIRQSLTLPVVAGALRVVRPNVGRPSDVSLKVTGLLAASPAAWGETSFRGTRSWSPDTSDFRADPRTGLYVAAVSERVTAANLPFSVRGGRLVVLGSSDVFSNNRLGNLGNNALILNILNWAVDRDAQVNIPPRPLERFQLALSATDLAKLRIGLLGIVPGVLGLLGLVVYWSRRS